MEEFRKEAILNLGVYLCETSKETTDLQTKIRASIARAYLEYCVAEGTVDTGTILNVLDIMEGREPKTTSVNV